jgi:DNA-binding CsgD family transcriptional regulator
LFRSFAGKIFLLGWATALLAFVAAGQSPIGKVEVTAYTRPEYAAGTQNWAMAVDPNGRLYAANNEGLLIYNGTNWQLYPVPNKTILRSIAFGPDGKLYAGAQDELGYYAPDHAGRLVYTSLKKLLPQPDISFADIWDIEVAGKEIFFRATDKIIRLQDGKMLVYTSPASWIALSKYNGRALAQDKQKGLLIFQNGQWQTLVGQNSLPAGFIVTDIIQYNEDTALVSTSNNGLFLLSQDKLQPFVLKKNTTERHFTSLAALGDGRFLAGTYSNGVYQINRNGEVLENITDKNGLQNNTVRCIYAGEGGNVWIGLDNGVAFMNVDDAIKHMNPPAFNNGSGYGATVLNGELYFALSTGLQWLPLSNTTDLSAVAGEPKTILDGLTWNVSVINNQLLTGRDDGFWKISNHQAAQVSSAPGYWTYQPVTATPSMQIAAGNYTGVHLFKEMNGDYADAGAIPNFNESSRYVETDGRSIWVSHPYRGVFKIDLRNKSVTKFSKANGLPADLDNHVFKIKSQVVFATPKGIYEYNAAENKMIPSPKYAELFGQMPLRYLKEDEKGNTWFVQDKMIGVADFSTPNPTIHFIPELKNRILSGFENIYPYNTENILVGSEKGFYHINYEKYRQKIQPLKAYITLVKIIGNGDSVLNGGYGFKSDEERATAVPYRWNSLHFSFATSAFGSQPGIEFSCWLEGFDATWSHWSTQHEKDYTNLPEGKYTFHVKSRNSPSNESGEYTYSFSISPPWFRSIWAYLLYVIAAAGFLYALYKFQDKKNRRKQEERRRADQEKFEEEQRRLTYQHQLELEKTEKELIRLKNEKLEAEIEHKNAELASTAMNLVQKKEFMLKLTDELSKLSKGKEMVETTELKKIIRSLGSEEKLDEEWKQFSIHFNNVHSNFLVTLKNTHPGLNAHELKLCAYLRMNLSSKEMAKLMSISVKGVEISRYRLRKKLQLQPKEDLFQYLLAVDAINKAGGQAKQQEQL